MKNASTFVNPSLSNCPSSSLKEREHFLEAEKVPLKSLKPQAKVSCQD